MMRIRLNYYTDQDPGSGNPPYQSGSGSKKKNSDTKFNFNFLEKSYLVRYLFTDIEQQLYIKLARVPRGQLRSQKSCKVP